MPWCVTTAEGCKGGIGSRQLKSMDDVGNTIQDVVS